MTNTNPYDQPPVADAQRQEAVTSFLDWSERHSFGLTEDDIEDVAIEVNKPERWYELTVLLKDGRAGVARFEMRKYAAGEAHPWRWVASLPETPKNSNG